MQRSYNKQHKLTKFTNKLLYILPGMALVIVAGLWLAKTATANTEEASAVTDPYGTGATFSILSDLNLTVSINDVNIPTITPTASGSFQSGSVDLTVDTNNTFGYALKMYAYNPYTSAATTNLTNPTALSSGEDAVIQTIASGSFTEAQFIASDATVNKWAFKSGDNYIPVASEMSLGSQTTQGSYDTSAVFGAKVNNSLPNGLYSVTLNFVATVNPPDASDSRSGFAQAFAYAGVDTYGTTGLYAMQDMTSTICGYVYNEKTAQMVDKRDGKVYWVTKLKDGNCWMTQNLDLDLDSTVALTNENTDLHSVTSWTPTRSTIDSTTYNNTTSGASGGILTYNGSNSHNGGFASGWTNDDNTPYSADPGYRYVVPKTMTAANTIWYDNGDTFYYCDNQDTTCGGNSENGHYTMGNFYNFAAATATNNIETTLGGSANVVQNTSMTDSICPKGWRLPIDETTNNEFNTLLGSANYNVTSSFNFAGLNAIRIAPLYFVRSGYVHGGTLYDAGVNSHSWSSTISSSTGGYDLGFNSTGVYPASNNNRLYGFSVRCLAW